MSAAGPGGGAADAWARGTLLGGAISAAGIAVLLASLGVLSVYDVLVLAGVLVLLPAAGLAQLPLIRPAELDRISVYGGSAALMVILAGVCSAVGVTQRGWGSLGLAPPPRVAVLGWALGLAAAGLLTVWAFRYVALKVGADESDVLRALLPATTGERWAFAALAVVAGIGEEVVFRGYAIPVLAEVTGSAAGAAAVTSLVFGVLHAYQGSIGIARTSVMGGMLAAGFLLSGSLWAPILGHALIDVLVGIFLAERLTASVD